MNRLVLVLATIAMTIGTATVATAQTAITSDESPFRFPFEQRKSPRGLAVEGYVQTFDMVMLEVPAPQAP